MRDSFLWEESCGLPHEMLLALGCDPNRTLIEAIDTIRDHGFALYEEALLMRIDVEAGTTQNDIGDVGRRRRRDDLVLRGNAWLAISEQALIQDDIAVAARINVRRWTTPPWVRTFRSQRVWREREVSGWRLRLENWFAGWATRKVLVFNHAPGAVMFRGRRSSRALRIVAWYPGGSARGSRGAGTWHELGTPFGLVDEVESVDLWSCFRQRVAAIMVLMATTHEAPWFAPHDATKASFPSFRNAHVPSRWRGYHVAIGKLDDRLRAPQERR